MVSQFDVFVSEPGGQVMWQGAVATLKDAEAMIKKLAQAFPDREYVIFNMKTGQKIVVKAEGLDEAFDALYPSVREFFRVHVRSPFLPF